MRWWHQAVTWRQNAAPQGLRGQEMGPASRTTAEMMVVDLPDEAA